MTTVSENELVRDMPALLDRVARGERIAITREGVSVAMLVPADTPSKRDVAAVIEDIRRFREGHTLEGLSIREMIEEGRRY